MTTRTEKVDVRVAILRLVRSFTTNIAAVWRFLAITDIISGFSRRSEGVETQRAK